VNPVRPYDGYSNYYGLDIMKKYMYDRLTITAQAYDRKVSVEHPQDLDMMELLDMFKAIAMGLTFSESTWEEAVITLAEEYNDLEDMDAISNS
jgi:hypothetical protein